MKFRRIWSNRMNQQRRISHNWRVIFKNWRNHMRLNSRNLRVRVRINRILLLKSWLKLRILWGIQRVKSNLYQMNSQNPKARLLLSKTQSRMFKFNVISSLRNWQIKSQSLMKKLKHWKRSRTPSWLNWKYRWRMKLKMQWSELLRSAKRNHLFNQKSQ